MGVKSKVSDAKRTEAVKQYAAGVAVPSLAKQYKVSVPAVYKWISQAKAAATARVKEAAAQPESEAVDPKLDKDMVITELKRENEILRRKLFELMVKHGEL